MLLSQWCHWVSQCYRAAEIRVGILITLLFVFRVWGCQRLQMITFLPQAAFGPCLILLGGLIWPTSEAQQEVRYSFAMGDAIKDPYPPHSLRLVSLLSQLQRPQSQVALRLPFLIISAVHINMCSSTCVTPFLLSEIYPCSFLIFLL